MPSTIFGQGRLTAGRPLKYQEVEREVRKLSETLPIGAKMPTERELAAIYGCSVLTVRRGLQVLADEGTIVRRMGSGTYVAKRSKKPVAAGRLLGVLVYEQSNAYASRLLQAIARTALQQNLQPRSVWIRGFDRDAQLQLESLRRDGCLAVTVPWFPAEQVDEARQFLTESGIPLSLPQLVPGFERYCFESPQLFGKHTGKMTELLCQYFQLLGNEHIAFLGPDAPHDVILQQQLIVYTSTMARLKRDPICALVSAGANAMDEVALRWASHKGNLAVISYDDEHALRFMTAMHKIGSSTPRDYRIVGYNNMDASRFSDPPLSTIAQDFDYVADGLIKTALALSEGRAEQSEQLPSSLLVMRSTCGGAGKIDDALREKLNGLTIVDESVVGGEEVDQN
ncbi:MAG: substrate-binding domain-containing protein [Nibricoccus sp.]